MDVNIPDEMLRKGRPVDPVFLSDEGLYYRFDSYDPDKLRVDPHQIRMFDQSVNRGKYSNPEWVLLPDKSSWGYGVFYVKDLPPFIRTETNVTHTYKMMHEPLEENYSHSEIASFNENRVRVKKRQKKVGAKFRVRLSQLIKILKLPDDD